MKEYTIATTDEMFEIAATAKERGYNRQLGERFLEDLDPKGIHVCYFHMLHEHAQRKPVAPHIRSSWFVKLRGIDIPVSGQLDIDMDFFLGLERRTI